MVFPARPAAKILWLITPHKVALSGIEKIEQRVNVKVRKWLGVPKCLANVALYCRSNKLHLPLPSLVEEFQVGKARVFCMFRNTQDRKSRDMEPDLNSGRKWDAEAAVTRAKSRAMHAEIVLHCIRLHMLELCSMSQLIFNQH